MNVPLLLAGAASLLGHDQILKAFADLGYTASFIEAPFIKKYMAPSSLYPATQYMDAAPAHSIVVPLSEYWISQCTKFHTCRISTTALKASRSKKFLYDFFSKNRIPSPQIFDTLNKAQEFIDHGGRVIVKPQGLFSGYGIKIVSMENRSELEHFAKRAASVNNNALKLFGITSTHALVTQVLEGTEFSADIFFYEGRISVVRLCRKVIANIHGTPCSAVCQLVPLTPKIEESLASWAELLFEKDNISFGQFDFIVTEESGIVPIDFACRIGGGMSELFSNHSRNLYADAISGSTYQVEDNGTYLTQFNYLPTKSGKIENENYNLMEGKTTIYKHKGDFVPECPSSNTSRIAVVVNKSPIINPTAELFKNLLVGDETIGFWKKSGHSKGQ